MGTASDYLPYDVGVYRSNDGGDNWDLLTGHCKSCNEDNVFVGTLIRSITVDPNFSNLNSGSVIYAAIDHSSSWSGLWRSEDGGDSWEPEFTTSSYNGIWDLAVDQDTSTVYIADSNGIYQKQFGGDWELIQSANSNWNAGNVHLSVVNSVPYFLAPTSGSSPIYKLYYANSANPTPTPTWVEVPTLLGSSPISPFKFAVSPSDANRIILGTAELYLTTNGGSTWTNIRQQSIGDLHVDTHAIAFSWH